MQMLSRQFALLGVTGTVRMALSMLDMALWDVKALTVGTAIQSIELEQIFLSEEECMNRGALVGRVMLLHEIKPEDEIKVICEHRRSDNH